MQTPQSKRLETTGGKIMDPIILVAKLAYLGFNMDKIRQDPTFWESLPHEKQIELHQIKAELDEFFKKEMKK